MTAADSGTSVRVALLDLGERLPASLDLLARKLNSLQSTFVFTIVTPITLAKIGDPSIIEGDRNAWYEFDRLFDLLRSHDCSSQYNYVIGITHLNVTERTDNGDKGCGDYFSLSDMERVAVTSVNPNILRHNSPSKSLYQYLAYLIACELLIMQCKKDLVHTKNNFCLFDDCVDRALFRGCIEIGEICEECTSELKKHNVSNKIIKDVLAVLKWCRTDSIKYSITSTLLHPIALLSIGTGLGWFAKTFVGPNYYLVVLCVCLLIPLLVFAHKRYMSR